MGSSRRVRAAVSFVLALAVAVLPRGQGAKAQPSSPGGLVDRVVVRFTSPDTGGSQNPQFVFERELAFAARLEALADPQFRPTADEHYLERHTRAALDAHIAETLLGSHEVFPPVTAQQLAVRRKAARGALAQRVGGEAILHTAAAEEGISREEVDALVTRRSKASLYLDRMVAPMLAPTESELQVAYRTSTTPFSNQPYERIASPLRRWYVAQRLRVAIRTYYEGARTRVKISQASL